MQLLTFVKYDQRLANWSDPYSPLRALWQHCHCVCASVVVRSGCQETRCVHCQWHVIAFTVSCEIYRLWNFYNKKETEWFFSLDLDAWINDPPTSSEEEDETAKMQEFNDNYDDYYSPNKDKKRELSEEEIARVLKPNIKCRKATTWRNVYFCCKGRVRNGTCGDLNCYSCEFTQRITSVLFKAAYDFLCWQVIVSNTPLVLLWQIFRNPCLTHISHSKAALRISQRVYEVDRYICVSLGSR